MITSTAVSNPRRLLASITRAGLSLFLLCALAVGFWIATISPAAGRELTSTEMIQEGLPPSKTMKSATKSELLSAICATLRRHRSAALAITKTAVAAHREYAGETVGTLIRCTTNIDCNLVGAMVAAAISADASSTSAIADAALAAAPGCAHAIQEATLRAANDRPAEGPSDLGSAGPTNQLPLPGSIGGGGGGFDPHEQLVLVCDNGTPRTVRESQLGEFLSSHPGSFAGSCQPTPRTNK
jgi:predicted regulator of Ras-like GTPase activity (Roadblock/LC7/MglB family)